VTGKPPSIGALRERLTLQSPSRTSDGGGGAAVTWDTVAELWAHVRPISGDERLRHDGVAGRITHEVWIRHRSDVVPAMRFTGDLALSWVRRTRIGGDSWDSVEVPLAEETERYEVDILDGPDVVRTISSSTPSLTYTAAEQTADFGAPQSSLSLRVYQLSPVFGRGTPHTTTL
jgi:SPP1 family predicted phage head-tail adaptor